MKDFLSRIERVKNGSGELVPCFIKVLDDQQCHVSISDIDEFCPDVMFPMILEKSDYVTSISIDAPPKRATIIAQLIHDLLEKKPDLNVTTTSRSVPWVIRCRFRFRSMSFTILDDNDLHSAGELLNAEENNIETTKPFTYSMSMLTGFLPCLGHTNCRVRELTTIQSGIDVNVLRNTLIRRVVVVKHYGEEWILFPYQVGEGEFETMLRVLRELRGLHRLRGCLHVDLWRVIFYFL